MHNSQVVHIYHSVFSLLLDNDMMVTRHDQRQVSGLAKERQSVQASSTIVQA